MWWLANKKTSKRMKKPSMAAGAGRTEGDGVDS
jgi:hypothetical protein